MSKKNLLERSFWSVTWPIVIDLSLGMTLIFTDFIFLSQVSDVVAASVGAILPVVYIAGTLYFPLGQGCSAILGKTLGAKNFGEVGEIHAISIWLSVCMGLLIFAILFGLHKHIGMWLGLKDEMLTHASQYLQLISVSLFFVCIQKVLSSVLRCHGDTHWVMYNAVIVNAINIFLNIIFLQQIIVTGLNGVQNVALATLVASFIGMLWCLFGVLKKLPHQTVWAVSRQKYQTITAAILRIAMPGTFEPLNYQVNQAVLVALIIPMGVIAVATRSYVMTCMVFLMVFELSIAIGTSIYIAHHIGAKEPEQANKRLRKNVVQAIFISISINSIFYLFGGLFLSVFTKETAIIELGKTLFLIGLFWGPARIVNVVIGNALRASGDAVFSSYISMSLWIVALPLAYLLGVQMSLGLIGVWVAITIDENLRAMLHFWRWERKMGNKKTDAELKLSTNV
jgi:putative MATE family efflux protein